MRSTDSLPAPRRDAGSPPLRSLRLKPAHRLVLAGHVASALSSPGQSFGIAFYVEAILLDLPISRTGIASLYGLATILAAATLPIVGVVADRLPPRRFLPLAVALLGVALWLFSMAQGPLMLFGALVAMRLFGQGAIGLGNITAVSRAYDRHRAKALALVTLGYPVGEMVFPILFLTTIAAMGWRGSLQMIAFAYVLVAATVLWWIIGRTPAMDATIGRGADFPTEERSDGWTFRAVLRHPVFLLAVVTSAALPLAMTGLLFHQIALFDRLGWGAGAVPPALAFFAVGGVTGTLLAGATLDRINPRWGFVVAGVAGLLALATTALDDPSWIAFASLLGLASGLGGGANGVIWSHHFGLPMLGRIKGTVTAVRNGATALGPPMVALGLGDRGSAFPALRLVAGVFALMIVLGALLPSQALARRGGTS